MDRRYNQRITADLPVRLSLLDSEEEATGRLLDISESGVGVLLRNAAKQGGTVKMEILGIIFYGYVAHSRPEGAGFRTGIAVEPALLDSSNILDLVSAFLATHVG